MIPDGIILRVSSPSYQMATVTDALHKRFFEAAELDLEAGRTLTNSNNSQLALYHLQQAYEKVVKSYYSLKESVNNKTPESEIYDKLIKLGHNTQESTIRLLHDVADGQKKVAEIQLQNATEPKVKDVLLKLISGIDGLNMSLDNLVTRLNLNANYIKNVRNYAQTVQNMYSTFQFSNVDIISKEPEQTFLQVVISLATLYPCFYRMEEITRYPLSEFQYENLDLLANQKHACEQLVEMLGDLFTVLSPYLSA